MVGHSPFLMDRPGAVGTEFDIWFWREMLNQQRVSGIRQNQRMGHKNYLIEWFLWLDLKRMRGSLTSPSRKAEGYVSDAIDDRTLLQKLNEIVPKSTLLHKSFFRCFTTFLQMPNNVQNIYSRCIVIVIVIILTSICHVWVKYCLALVAECCDIIWRRL